MFKKLTDIFSIAKKAVKSVAGKVLRTPKTPKAPVSPVSTVKEKQKDVEYPTLPEIKIDEPQEQKQEPEPVEKTEEQLAEDVIDNIKDKIRSMDEKGYTPSSPHFWSLTPEKSPNSHGAGRAKEESGNKIIEVIDEAVKNTDAITVARSLEQYWDGILYEIERLEFAIYDTEYRKRSGGSASYETGMLKLEGMLKIGSDEEVKGKYI